MKCFISSLILFFSLRVFAAEGETTYNLKWEYGKLPIEIKMYEGAIALAYRISETGEFKERSQLPIVNDLRDGKIAAKPGEEKIIILVVRNTSEKALRFAVAPHGIQPVDASLGINFTCLCNGHTYTIEPKKSWYRIMKLKAFRAVQASKTEVALTHKVFAVTGKATAPHAHSH